MDSANKDRMQGGKDEIVGKAKSAWGDATGDEQAKAEGEKDQAKGKMQQGVADAKDKVGDAIDGLTGNKQNR